MIKERVWRCFYEDGFFVDVRRKTKPKSSPFPHKGELVRVERVEDPSSGVETIQEKWEAITREVKSYAQEMSYEHKNYSTLNGKYMVNELYQSWEYANRIDSPLLNTKTPDNFGSDLLSVFSTATVFEPERGYTKFAAFTLLNYGSLSSHVFTEAARHLVQSGYY